MRPFLLSSTTRHHAGAARSYFQSHPMRAQQGTGAGKTYVSFLLQSCLYNMSKIDTGMPAPEGADPASVENNGFEPLTPCLQSRCSSQLS